MNKYIKTNFNKILSIFILIQPILDLLTGICVHTLNINLTLGIFVRVLFLLFIMYTTTFIYKKKIPLYVYIAVLVYSILYLLGIIIYKDGVVFKEVQGLVKVFYFPLILISLYELKDEFKISKLTLFTTLGLYLVLILIPNLLGLGFKSYEITKSGTLGFFNSANEISGIISILTPVMFVMFKNLKSKVLKIVYALIYLVVILTIGTKTPLLTLLITIGITFLWFMINCLKQKKYKPVLYSGLIILIGLTSLVLVIPKTNFYKNIEVHLDYLEVDNIFEIFEDKELVDHFIFSQRLTFLNKKAHIYQSSSTYEKIFGIGYIQNNKTTKLIEMDYFDIFYSHGIIGFILFFGIYFTVLYQVIKDKQQQTYERLMTQLSVILIIVLSFFTGHIITAPAVSLLTIIILLDLAKRKRKLLFTAVNLEMGGIENALINLLKYIDYKKYSVEVILENKKGALLRRVNKKVKLKELKVSNHKNIIIRKLTNLGRKVMFAIEEYNNYDFSCCYATYSYSSNKLARLASKNSSIYIHSNYSQLYPKKAEFKEFFDTRKITEFNKIIFVSNESRKSFLRIYPRLKQKTEVVNNFINVEKIKELSEGEIDEIRLRKKKLFVFVGRLDDSSKKVKRAINLVKEIDEIELWIIGDGPDKKMYEEYTKENKLEKRVRFLGMKLNPYQYMIEADYIILTSDYEGFPVTYLEAIVLEKPIITTIDVSDDQINIGKDYAHIIPKNEKAMVKKVRSILEKKSKINNIDFNNIQQKRMEKLEVIFDEVM